MLEETALCFVSAIREGAVVFYFLFHSDRSLWFFRSCASSMFQMLSSLCQTCSCGAGFVDCADLDADAPALLGPIITLSHLFKREGHPSRETLMRVSCDKKRIAWLAEETAALTGLDDFPQYLTLLFELDALFLNDDRHWNKIAVLEKMGALTTVPSLITEQDFYPKNSTPSGFGRVLLYIFPPGTTKQAGAGFVPALLLL